MFGMFNIKPSYFCMLFIIIAVHLIFLCYAYLSIHFFKSKIMCNLRLYTNLILKHEQYELKNLFFTCNKHSIITF